MSVFLTPKGWLSTVCSTGLALVLVLGALHAPPLRAQGETPSAEAATENTGMRSKPRTQRTQALSKETFAVLEAAQTLYEAKDYAASEAKLEALKPRFERLNDLEKATYWNFKASLRYARDDSEGAMEAYKNVLRQKNLPVLLRNNTVYAIAQLAFASSRFAQAIQLMRKWMTLGAEVKPEQHMLIAQAHFQLKEYVEAAQATDEALKVAKLKQIEVKENWLALLRAAYYERKDYPRTTKVLEEIVQRWPKTTYWLQLGGLYGLTERPDQQLAVLRANHEAGMLRKEGDLLNLARLYLLAETPYPAVQVLKKGYQQKRIQESLVSIQLYAQALSMAREHEEEIAALSKLAALSKEAKHYIYLGQAHVRLGQWPEAVAAYRQASAAGNAEKPGSVQMMIGNALYNQKKYAEAKAAFQAALQYQDTVKDAAMWVNFMDKEMQRTHPLEEEERDYLKT